MGSARAKAQKPDSSVAQFYAAIWPLFTLRLTGMGGAEKIQERLTVARQELAELQQKKDAAEKHGNNLQARIKNLKTEIKRVQADMAAQSKTLLNTKSVISVLKKSIATQRESISGLAEDMQQRKRTINTLEGKLQDQMDLLREAKNTAADTEKAYKAGKAAAALREQSLTARISDMKTQIAGLKTDLSAAGMVATKAADEITALNIAIDGLKTGISTAQVKIVGLDKAITRLEGEKLALKDGMKGLSAKLAKAEVERNGLEKKLVAQINRLKSENADHLNDLKAKAQIITILEQNVRENRAKTETLKQKIDELKQQNPLDRFRTGFFANLSGVLDGREGFASSGDRFYVQAEVLFNSGSADVNEDGKRQIKRMAVVTGKLAEIIPSDVDWVLQINGHTDIRKVRHGSKFRDNWELSTARALAVVRLLITYGAPEDHLAAAGFGAQHPIAQGTTAADFKRNRRIELVLTN